MEDFMEKNLNWAVLGTGVIANEMAQALKAMGKTLYAVGNRTHEKAVTFAEKYQVAKVYDDFHEMFTDPDVDVIYITTPHNTHIGFVREALKNKKHVLCEKSITLNSLELEEALALAKENDVIIVLKGANTIVTNGVDVYFNTTGNPGMAMGGTGDMLAGIIGSFAAQGIEPIEACKAAVYIHGRCGDIAAQEISTRGMTVDDMIYVLGALMSEFE
jgi:NAD(P)H-hydrate repair Nnr-like enzyme with NAD(P)H-hydrate dehydratase domain